MSNKKLKRCYFIHDNGGKPFKVCNYSNDTLSIFINKLRTEDDHSEYRNETKIYNNDEETDVYKLWKSFYYHKIWIPKDTGRNAAANSKSGVGNSILIQTANNKYIFIGSKILEFTTKIPIVDFQSPIGNSDVPYPYARTNDSYILFAPSGYTEHKEKLKIEEMEINDENKNISNPYDKYYEKTYPAANNSKFGGKNIKSAKVLHERLFDIFLRNNKAKKTTRSTKAKRTTRSNRSTQAKKTTRSNRSTKAKRTSRPTKAKRTTRSNRSTKAKRTTRSRTTRRS